MSREVATRQQDVRIMAMAGMVAVLIVAAYTMLRYVLVSPAALVASQVIYVGAPGAAAAISVGILLKAPRGSRSRLAWTLLAVAMSLLFLSEASWAWSTLVYGLPSDPIGGVADIANLAATVTFLALIAVSNPSPEADRTRSTRRLLDLVVIGVLAFVLLFQYWIVGLIGTASTAEVMEAVRLALYASVGVVVMVGSLLTFRVFTPGVPRIWLRLLRAGLVVFSVGIVTFPVWSLAVSGVGAQWIAPVTSLIYLIGYVYIAYAAAARLADREAGWGWGSRAVEIGSVWPGLVASTVAMVSVVLLGWAATTAEVFSAEQSVYFSALYVATACLVGRTVLTSAEAARLRSATTIDPVTGASNRRAIDDRFVELGLRASAHGESYAVIVVDLDDFTEFSRVHGVETGDEMLKRAAGALAENSIGSAVYRLTADTFVILVSCDSRAAADRVARDLLKAIDEVGIFGLEVTASVGYAVSPWDGTDPHELLRLAEGALAWAKYHGKHRVVAHDADIVVALTAQERRALGGDPTRLNVALALAAATDAYDSSNYRHARNVAALCVLFARDELSWGADEIARLELAAVLHDVGKIVVPVTPTPRAQRSNAAAARRHPEFGAYMVEALELEDLGEWVKGHHERWDGTGYPTGLAGEAIPLAARVIALADAYDAMTTPGSSQRARSRAAALQEIDLGLGTQFDPELGERFIAFVARHGVLGWSDAEPAA